MAEQAVTWGLTKATGVVIIVALAAVAGAKAAGKYANGLLR